MKIVADENIPYVQEVFSPIGQVACYPGRALTADRAADADVLLVRSVTRVDKSLLNGAVVKFVGTATIGTDHIDQVYLAERQISFCSAAGSNSNSVAEYVMTALLVLAERFGWELSQKTLGIIGVGNIGSKVKQKAGSLGMRVLLNDPPLQRQTGDASFVSLEDVLQADMVTCHVPLARGGSDPTWHLLNNKTLGMMSNQTVLINSSRGAVVDNAALKDTISSGRLGPTVLDVWEGEPAIDVELLERVSLATPHIAGYSFDGKVNGTVMLYEHLCRFLKRDTAGVTAEKLLPAPPSPVLNLQTQGKTDQQVLAEAMTGIYDIERDDRALRAMAGVSADQQGKFFDQLRKQYPVRREAHNTKVQLQPSRESLAKKLALLGFQ